MTGFDGPWILPEGVSRWFKDVATLKGVPFNYLVPDARMLPTESIRFFQIDPYWLECLLDAAFSIGGISDQDRSRDAEHVNFVGKSSRKEALSGFLLRSRVVSGWPDLQVDGYADAIDGINSPGEDNPPLELLRIERFSPNVLFCLFDGEARTVDVHLKPEALHFGVSRLDDEHIIADYPGGYYKDLRSRTGTEELSESVFDGTLNLQALNRGDLDEVTRRTLNIKAGEARVKCLEQNKRWRVTSKETVGGMTLHWTFHLENDRDKFKWKRSLAVNVPFRERRSRVINVGRLAGELCAGLGRFQSPQERFTAAEFALEMVEGVQKVRFTMAK